MAGYPPSLGPDGRPIDQDQVDEQALTFEKALETAAVAVTLTYLAGLMTRAALHLQLGGDVRTWLARELRAAPVVATGQVQARIGQGLRLGAVQAAADAGSTEGLPALALDDATAAAVAGLDATIHAGIADAARLAEQMPLTTKGDVTTAIAPALGATNRAGAATRWAANRAVNVGTATVAEDLDAEIVWLSERNACLVCLALSGEVRRPGETFDASATFGSPMPLFPLDDPQPLDHPPRHPNCRCKTRVWLPGSDPSFLTALKREAQRTVARGWSDYASERQALSAADRLLRHPTLLPRSVESRGRRAVAAGTFGT